MSDQARTAANWMVEAATEIEDSSIQALRFTTRQAYIDASVVIIAKHFPVSDDAKAAISEVTAGKDALIAELVKAIEIIRHKHTGPHGHAAVPTSTVAICDAALAAAEAGEERKD